MPNYKNYKNIISGISQARMIKGVKGRNTVESQILTLFSTYELEKELHGMVFFYKKYLQKKGLTNMV